MHNIYYTMSASFFNINKFCALEYIYGKPTDTISTNVAGFRKITNTKNGEKISVNDNNSKSLTGNVIDDTVAYLEPNKVVVLDNDAAYFYPGFDPDVQVSGVTISPSAKNVVYDTVRIHIISGYNFESLQGFIASVYLRLSDDTQLKLFNTNLLKSEFGRLKFNPNPLKLSELIYDKYLELKVPSQRYMLEEQLSTAAPNTLIYQISGGNTLVNQNTIYFEFSDIVEQSTSEINGFRTLRTGQNQRFALASRDQFDGLVARIRQSESGDYFEYFGEFEGSTIENLIFRLNSVAGNNYYAIHDIRLSEQVNETFTQTDIFSSIQTSGYDKLNFYRPILRSQSPVSFNIEYTLRLYNSFDGKSIFKTSSLSSFDTGLYGKTLMKLNVGNTSNPLKIYNKIVANPAFNIKEEINTIVKTRILNAFVNINNVVAASDSDINKSISKLLIEINPFDNILKFVVSNRINKSQTILNLNDGLKYSMVFIKEDGSEINIREFTNTQTKKENGELMFKISKSQAKVILGVTNKDFYIVGKNDDGIETVLLKGKFTNSKIKIEPIDLELDQLTL